jgi:thiol:disulfide interchange protein DsbC
LAATSGLALSVITGVVSAQIMDRPEGAPDPDALALDESIESVTLPMNRLVVSERDGQFRIVSDNGRYFFRGTIYDAWEETEIQTLEKARHSASHIDFDGNSLDIERLDPLPYGEGEQRTVVFFQPGQARNRALFNAIAERRDRVDVRLIALPSSAIPESAMIASACPTNPEAAGEAFITGEGLDRISHRGDCDPAIMNFRNISKYLLGFLDLPLVVRSDDRVHSGVNEDWEAFLASTRERVDE